MLASVTWQKGATIALILLTVVLAFNADYKRLVWAESLTSQGSSAPEFDSNSPTGYELGQRHFLATSNHGATYRWIAYTQELVENGPHSSNFYSSDSNPIGRPKQLPKLFAGWVALIAGSINLLTDLKLPIAIEKSTLWEPLVSHIIAIALIIGFITRRFNLLAGALTGLLFASFPIFSAQFIPGSIDSDRWALLFASFAIAISIPVKETPPKLNTSSAVLAGLALWLDPKFGFTAMLLIGLIYSFRLTPAGPNFAFLKWAIVGACVSMCGWLVDQNPLSLEASELRYNHPLYSLSLLGLGLTLEGIQALVSKRKRSKVVYLNLSFGFVLFVSIFCIQFSKGYLGWLHPSASTQSLSDLQAPLLFESAIAWIGSSTPAEIVFSFLIPVMALACQLFDFVSRKEWSAGQKRDALVRTAIIIIMMILAFYKIRWAIALSLISMPILWSFESQIKSNLRKYLTPSTVGLTLLCLLAWSRDLPESLHRPSGKDALRGADLESLALRHLSHWMASHNPTREVNALASPSQSDSLIFHGGCKAAFSSAWESYPGQIAASRILSAPEDTEVQAVLESRKITHILLSSWDSVLPQLVQQPQAPDSSTFYQRLQIWILPLYLRAIPYHLPPISGFETEKLAVFEVCPQQDEALSMSRLAEYFIEMNRPEPASLVAGAIEEAYPEDPNAQTALSIVYRSLQEKFEAREQSANIALRIESGYIPFDWDRRVIQSIALALNKNGKLAKSELSACIQSMSAESLYALTALQTYQLLSLAEAFDLTIPNKLKQIAINRCSEYL